MSPLAKKLIISLAICLLILSSGGLQAREVSNYHIKASLDPDHRVIEGVVEANFYNYAVKADLLS